MKTRNFLFATICLFYSVVEFFKFIGSTVLSLFTKSAEKVYYSDCVLFRRDHRNQEGDREPFVFLKSKLTLEEKHVIMDLSVNIVPSELFEEDFRYITRELANDQPDIAMAIKLWELWHIVTDKDLIELILNKEGNLQWTT